MAKILKPDDIPHGLNIDLGHRPDALTYSKWKTIQKRDCSICFRNRWWYFREAVLGDQEGNLVLCYLAKLFDGETYEWYSWLNPQDVKLAGGKHDPLFPMSTILPDALFKSYRIQAISKFEEAERGIRPSVVIHAKDKTNPQRKKDEPTNNVASGQADLASDGTGVNEGKLDQLQKDSMEETD